MTVKAVWKPELSDERPGNHLNYLAASVVLYGLTGKYPDDIWHDDIYVQYTSAFQNNVFRDSFKNHPGSQFFSKKCNEVIRIFTAYVEYCARKELDAEYSFSTKTASTKTAEMLVTCFITKYYLFSPKLWIKSLEGMKPGFQASYQIRSDTDIDLKTAICEGHSISVQGETHRTCDDCAGIQSFADNPSVLAFCADGVGSAISSRYGSKAAGEALSICFESKIQNLEQDIGQFLQYLYTDFSKELVREWEERLVDDHGTKLTPETCQTSLLFTLVCREHIVCGIIGDGVFVVEKVEKIGDYTYRGYFRLTDGISGVTISSIQHLGSLKYNPHALKLQIFSSSEISSILMASDGANGLLYDDIDGCLVPADDTMNVRSHIRTLQEIPYPERKTCIKKLAFRYSRSNSTAGGMADDCSLVFLNMPENRIREKQPKKSEKKHVEY